MYPQTCKPQTSELRTCKASKANKCQLVLYGYGYECYVLQISIIEYAHVYIKHIHRYLYVSPLRALL